MKSKISGGLFLILFLGVLHIYAQDGSFTLTASSTRGNIYRATVKIDNSMLNNNPDALVFVKQISGATHPIGVWYLSGNWHVVNRDQSSMAEGNQYQIIFWNKPDAMRFVHIVDAAKNLKSNGASLIDHPALNNHPNASWDVTQSTAGYGNPNMVKGEYEYTLKKWYLVNENGTALLNLNSYNIAVYSSGAFDGKEAIQKPDGLVSPTKNVLNNSPSPSPTGNAGGDLNGSYPNPNVIGLNGRPLSNVQPKIGDTLKWDGTQWKPTSEEQKLITAINPNPNPPTTSNPTASGNTIEPLKFNPTLGRKIVLYPGQTGDVGIGVAGNLLQIYSDNPNADVAIGYDQAGTFNEKFRVKANGAIAFNGNAGQAGQVLTSNGAGSAPTWQMPQSNSGGAGGVKTYFKNIPQPQTAQWVDGSQKLNLTAINYSVTLDKKSRLRITGKIKIEKDVCGLCNDPIGYFFIHIDGSVKPETTVYLDTNTGSSVFKGKVFTIPDYMIELEPGTHTIEFWVSHVDSTTRFSVVPHYSSVMVLPVE